MGASSQSSIDEMIGRHVGRYQIVRHLASGGMAELFIARQEAMGGFEKEVVLKILQGRYAESPRVVQMFLDEARLAAKLNHQSIVHVYDVAEDHEPGQAGLKYIAMEYIRGETVTDIVRRAQAVGKPLPIEHAVHIVRQTAAGLAYAHAFREPDGHVLRIVHRDVSPTNILVTLEGQTKIVDFGIARAENELRDEAGVRLGKASYMSPEQVRGDNVDTRSDIFSLGIILYEVTVGQRLFRGTPDVVMKRIVDEKVTPPTAVQRDYPPALELVVMRALEKNPDDRYQSAEQMRVDLEEFLADEGLRTGSRRVALYMKELFPPQGAAAGEPLASGEGGSDPGGVPLVARLRDDSEELDFDRRAPLSMRLEAGTADEPPGARGRAPIPTEDPPPPVRASSRASAKQNGVGKAPAPAPAPPPELPALPTRAPSRAMPVPASPGDSDERPATGGKGLRWLILLVVLAGAAIMAFTVLK
ncbi:MAG TPA: serine/threonine-protein kinase [Polyangia bacterium]|nr:serine/threonine-protein kinase [Polyangia bacterium]